MGASTSTTHLGGRLACEVADRARVHGRQDGDGESRPRRGQDTNGTGHHVVALLVVLHADEDAVDARRQITCRRSGGGSGANGGADGVGTHVVHHQLVTVTGDVLGDGAADDPGPDATHARAQIPGSMQESSVLDLEGEPHGSTGTDRAG
jgi:hypothetical protein